MKDKILKKFQSAYFKGSMFIRGQLGYPAQTRRDIEIFKSVFDYFSDRQLRVFEWGSGFSSIYFSNYLRKKGINFKWHSIDNNRSWHEKVQGMIEKQGLSSNVVLHLEEFLSYWEKPQWKWDNVPPARGVFDPKSESEKNYVNFPVNLNKTFDIVIIDARFRRRCLESAQKVIEPQGAVIMHDAQKAHYQSGLDQFQYGQSYKTGEWYPFQETPNEVWVGSTQNSNIFEHLKKFNSL